MTDQQHREAHEAFMKRLDALDRQYAPDPPESPEEAEWLENRMKEITNSLYLRPHYGNELRPLLQQGMRHEAQMPPLFSVQE